MDRKNTLVLSNHHRRISFFEDTISKLWDSGYRNIIIQHTGSGSPTYQGPCSSLKDVGQKSYDMGMVLFKQQIPSSVLSKYRQILLIDNDCFSTVEGVDNFIQGFENGNYDFSSHHVSISDYPDSYVFEDYIAHVKNQTFLPAKQKPGFVPVPHWENCFTLIKTDLWDKLPENSFSHSRLWIKTMSDFKAKFGAHQAKYKLKFSHYGDDWFHIGNLMKFVYWAEQGNWDKFDSDSVLSMSRLGFLLTQPWYKCPLPPSVKKKGREAWEELISDTVLRDWS